VVVLASDHDKMIKNHHPIGPAHTHVRKTGLAALEQSTLTAPPTNPELRHCLRRPALGHCGHRNVTEVLANRENYDTHTT
jgi:hypothetical protein